MEGVDWEVLFWKYADHVGHEEGVEFLTSQTHYSFSKREDVKWCTDEEWAAINNSGEATE